MASPLQERDDSAKQDLLFLTARPEEYESCLSDHDFDRRLHLNRQYYVLDLPDGQVKLTHVGIGPENARRTLEQFEGILDPDFFLVLGTAGSLTENLQPGSVFFPTAVTSTDRDEWLHPSREFLQWGLATLEESSKIDGSFRSGPLVTSQRPITAVEERNELKQQNQAMAVDMETETIVRKLVSKQQPEPGWLPLRIISDGPESTTLEEVKRKQSTASEVTGRILSTLIDQIKDQKK